MTSTANPSDQTSLVASTILSAAQASIDRAQRQHGDLNVYNGKIIEMHNVILRMAGVLDGKAVDARVLAALEMGKSVVALLSSRDPIAAVAVSMGELSKLGAMIHADAQLGENPDEDLTPAPAPAPAPTASTAPTPAPAPRPVPDTPKPPAPLRTFNLPQRAGAKAADTPPAPDTAATDTKAGQS